MTLNLTGGQIECRSSIASPRLKVTRVKNRVYESGSSRVKRHAEYALVVERKTVAHIINGNGKMWVVVEGHTDNKFGVVISPMNLRLIRELREWFTEKWRIRKDQEDGRED